MKVMPMVQIRKITSHDTPQVKALIHDILQAEFSAERRAYDAGDLEDPVRYYGGEKDIFLVAEKDGKVIGTVAINPTFATRR
jgi:N-acetylglutamate synthase-like GNAT family acetyltransferase